MNRCSTSLGSTSTTITTLDPGRKTWPRSKVSPTYRNRCRTATETPVAHLPEPRPETGTRGPKPIWKA